LEGGEYLQWCIVTVKGHPYLRAVIENVLRNIDEYTILRFGVGKNGTIRLTGPVTYTLAIETIREKHPYVLLANPLERGFLYSGLEGKSHVGVLGKNAHYSSLELPMVEGDDRWEITEKGSHSKNSTHTFRIEMAYHIITGKQFDLNLISTSSDKGLRPRHAIVDLAAAMDAKVHFPSGRDLSVIDKLRGRILGNPDAWALARRVVGREILDGDVVYCTGEDIGVPIASTCAQRGIKARIAVFVHNLDRPRSRFGLRLFGSAKNISLFIACSRHQIDFLMNHLQVAQEKLLPVWDSIDTEFFTPGAIKRDKPRPLIVAAGLEKRDYRTVRFPIHSLKT